MKHFFVDYENVTDAGLRGCNKLKKEDLITIFYSENAHKIDLRVIRPILSRIKIEIWLLNIKNRW